MRDLVHSALTVALALGWAREVRLRRRTEAKLAFLLSDDLDEELRQLAVMAVGSADAVAQRGKFLLNDR